MLKIEYELNKCSYLIDNHSLALHGKTYNDVIELLILGGVTIYFYDVIIIETIPFFIKCLLLKIN